MKRFLFAAFAFGLALLPSATAQDAKAIRVVMETSHGKIVVELNAEEVNNLADALKAVVS